MLFNESNSIISIIVPVYNERRVVESTAQRIMAVFKNIDDDVELLFIDDNSPDGTAEEVIRVSKFIPEVKLIQNGNKEGIGAAHRAGYEAAVGKYILCIDADLSQSPEDLLKIKQKLDDGYDLVIGSRYMKDGKQLGKSPLRDLGSRGMNLLCRIVLGLKLTDSTHTFRGFKSNLYKKYSSRLNSKGHPDFQVEFSFWIQKDGNKVIELPIHFKEREESLGQSKIIIHKEAPRFLKLLIKLFVARLLRD